MEELRITITGTLDQSKTVEAINKALEDIQKQIGKIKFSIDDEALKKIKDSTQTFKTTSDDIKNTNKVLREQVNIIKNLDGTQDRIKKTFFENGEIIESHTNELQKQIQINKELIDLYQTQARLQKSTVKVDSEGEFAGQVDVFKNQEDAVTITRRLTDSGKEYVQVVKDLAQAQRNAQKEVVGTSEKLRDLSKVTDKTIVDILKINNSIKHTDEVLGAEFDKVTGQWAVTVRENGKQVRVLKGNVDQVNASLLKHKDVIKQAHSANLGFSEQLKVALQRVPIWMSAMTVFYGSIRTLRNMTQVIVEVDTAITNLRKVMDTNEPRVFVEMLDSAISKAKELGQTVTDVLESFTLGAKSGLSAEDIEFLSDASLIASNVGEIGAAESAEYLISAIEQMKMSYSESMKIIDAWNNLANKNATTVKDLAEGWANSASTVRNFGGDMHELNAAIGSLNQVLKQSGNEIGNFLKSAMPRLLSSEVEKTLASVGISVREANGEMKGAFKIYREVAKALDEGRISAEGFNRAALALGGRYHVTRVMALIESMRELNGEQSLYDKMLNESINSVGSATQENLIYLESIEAQQRRLVAAFQEFSLVAGEKSLTPIYRELLDTLTGLLTVATAIVEKFGFLPPIFGTLAGVIFLFSSRLRAAASTTKVFLAVRDKLQNGLGLLTKAFKALGIQIEATSKAATFLSKMPKTLSYLGMAGGIGLITSLLGGLIEKFAQAKAEQRELERQTKELVNSYSANRQELESLIKEYKTLDSISQRSVQQEERYVEVANRIAEIMPSLVESKDAEGNARLRNAEAIDKEIASLKELSSLEAIEFISDFDDETKKVNKNIRSIEKDIDKLYKKQARLDGAIHLGTRADELTDPNLIKQELMYRRQLDSALDQMYDLHIELANAVLIRDGATQQLTDTQKEYIRTILDELGYTEEAQNAIELYAGDIAELSQKYQELTNVEAGWIAQQISTAFGEAKVAREDVDGLVERVVKLKDELGEGFDISKIDFSQLDVIEDVVKSVDEGSTAWEKFRDSLINAGLESNQIAIILGNLRNTKADVRQAAEELGYAGENLIPVYNDLGEIVSFTGQMFNEETEAIEENTDAKWQNASLTEILYGVTAEQVKQMKEAIKIVALLSDMENLNANQKQMLAEATAFLSQMYPHLNGNIKESLGWLQSEAHMLDQLNTASGENAYVMMTNQDNLTKSTVDAVNQRILALNKEYKALQDVIQANLEYNDYAIDPLTRSLMGRLRNIRMELAQAYSTRQEVLYGKGIVERPTFSSPKSKTSGKSSSTSKERQIDKHLTDQYAQAVENLNYQLAQSQSRLEKLEDTSSAYRKELQNQIKLYQQQIDLANAERKRLEERNNALQKQLKAMGNFNKLSTENKEKYNEIAKEIDQNKSKIIDLKQTALDAADKIYNANMKIRDSYEKIADEYISLYKDLLKVQRDESIKAIEKELEVFEKAYRRKMDMLNEELKMYDEIIKERLKLLDQEESEEDFNQKLAAKEEERQKLLRELNQWRLDDSIEGRKRVTELEEELSKIELEIQELMRDRERELIRQSLEEQLEEKRKQIEAEQELEEEKYQKQREMLEEQREEIQRHYENLLNDERAFAQMREQILAGNVQNLSAKLSEFATFVKNNMKSIGESISQNFLDKIKEAQNLLKGINSKAPSPTSGVPSNSGSGSSSSGKSSSSSSSKKSNSGLNTSGLPLRKRSGGFATPKGGWDPNSVVDTLKKHGYYGEFSDLKNIYYALGGSGNYKGTASQNTWMLSQLKKRGFKRGGYIPHDGIAWVDSGERVLTRQQTKAFDKLVSWLEKSRITLNPSVKLPGNLYPIGLERQKIINVSMPVTIENMNGTQEDANRALDIIGKGLRQVFTKI